MKYGGGFVSNGGIMNKCLLATAFFALVINTASPMNEVFGYEEFLCQYPELAIIIFSQLDGKAFSSLAIVSTKLGVIAAKILTKDLVFITCADAISHGNLNLIQRYLQENLGKNDTLIFAPTNIKDLLSEQVYGQEVLKLCKIMFGELQIYKIAHSLDGLNEVAQYVIYIKGSTDYVLLTLSPCQDLRMSEDFSDKFTEDIETHCFKHAPALCSFLNLALMSDDELDLTSCPSKDYFASAICSEDEMIKEVGGNVFLNLIDTNTSTDLPYDRFQYFCSNIVFIAEAQKNHTAVIRLMLKNPIMLACLQSGPLKIAARLTTCPEILLMIEEVLKQCDNSDCV